LAKLPKLVKSHIDHGVQALDHPRQMSRLEL